ncbi:MAG TPA: dethiobiotin synthase [Kofleriaceae bacterium]|jgi:dethiobiotin synthetase|nr:dethiobiotin synthase [Kofleriaceae bacterium]
MNGFFVTGTGTGVGKTFVTCALTRRAREWGQRVFAFKPIETGCVVGNDGLVGEDQALLVDAAGNWQTGELGGVYRFRMPAAPLVAATSEGEIVDLERVSSVLARGARDADVVLMEGAGGWRVPVTDGVDMGGLARRSGLRLVVVARAGLGTINHSLLTIEAAERDGIGVEALVLSRRADDDDVLVSTNVEQIARLWPGRIITFSGRLADLDPLLGRIVPREKVLAGTFST